MLPITFSFPWNPDDPEKNRRKLQEYADHGIQYFVLGSGLLEMLLGNPGLAYEIKKQAEEFHFTFMDAHAPWGTWADLGIPLEQPRQIASDRHRAAIRFCRQFGVRTLAFHTGNTFRSVFGDFTLEDYRAALRRTLTELLPVAEECGVILALENQWTPLNHTKQLVGFMREFDSPNLGLCYDTGHANLMENGENPATKKCVSPLWDEINLPVEWEHNIIDAFIPWMVNCHVHDNDGSWDQHKLPGQGSIDWKRIAAGLRKAPRLQCLQSEVNEIGWNIPLPEHFKAMSNLSAMI